MYGSMSGLVNFGTIDNYYIETEEPTVEETTSETTIPEETISETTIPEEIIPETTVPEETIPGTTVPEEITVPKETISETTIPEQTNITSVNPTPNPDTGDRKGIILLISLLTVFLASGCVIVILHRKK
ncbi:MAG: hypothetical protein ACI4C1_07190 [Lachnospiraceae bacterium]